MQSKPSIEMFGMDKDKDSKKLGDIRIGQSQLNNMIYIFGDMATYASNIKSVMDAITLNKSKRIGNTLIIIKPFVKDDDKILNGDDKTIMSSGLNTLRKYLEPVDYIGCEKLSGNLIINFRLS